MNNFFIALELSNKSVQCLLEDLAKEPYLKSMKDMRWVPIDNWHVTLAFLGKQKRARIESFEQQFRQDNIKFNPFDVHINRLNLFPTKKPHVLAFMMELNDALKQLKAQVNELLGEEKLSIESRAFTPHLTVARCRKPFFWQGKSVHHQLPVENLTLFESVKTPRGIKYSPLARLSL